MSKEAIIKTLMAKMEKIWIPMQTGKEADLMIDCDFLLNEMGFPKIPLHYKAAAFLDETKKTMFFWDSLWEQKKSLANGKETVEYVPSRFINIWVIKNNPDGTSDLLYAIDIPSIRCAFKDIAKSYGWKFKKVKKREDALYPTGYIPQQYSEPDHQIRNRKRPKAGLIIWLPLIILFIFFVMLFLPILNTFSWLAWMVAILFFVGVYFLQYYIYRHKGWLLFISIWILSGILMLFTFAAVTS